MNSPAASGFATSPNEADITIKRVRRSLSGKQFTEAHISVESILSYLPESGCVDPLQYAETSLEPNATWDGFMRFLPQCSRQLQEQYAESLTSDGTERFRLKYMRVERRPHADVWTNQERLDSI